MKSMIEAVNAMDEYIYRQLGFACKQSETELFTDGVATIYIQNTKTMIKPLCWMVNAGIHDLIDARNFIVFGKARRIKANVSDTGSSK
jgi:hypothetical protein